MKVISPATINDAQIISSNVPETEYAAYAASTNYAVGVSVIYLHTIYQSVQTPNTGRTPDTSPLYWTATGPTNRQAMFDGKVGTQTAISGPLTVTVAPGVVTSSLALLELEANDVSISITDGPGGAVIYTYTGTLEGSIVSDWYAYFYEPLQRQRQLVLNNLPAYGTSNVTVTLTGSGNIKCGYLIMGTAYDLGLTQYGATAGIIDYSRKDTSTTGVTTFTKRNFSKRMTARLELNNGQLDKVQRVLSDLRATPAVWIGTEVAGYAALTVYGFYKDFSLDIAYPTTVFCSLEIEGLI